MFIDRFSLLQRPISLVSAPQLNHSLPFSLFFFPQFCSYFLSVPIFPLLVFCRWFSFCSYIFVARSHFGVWRSTLCNFERFYSLCSPRLCDRPWKPFLFWYIWFKANVPLRQKVCLVRWTARGIMTDKCWCFWRTMGVSGRKGRLGSHYIWSYSNLRFVRCVEERAYEHRLATFINFYISNDPKRRRLRWVRFVFIVRLRLFFEWRNCISAAGIFGLRMERIPRLVHHYLQGGKAPIFMQLHQRFILKRRFLFQIREGLKS